MPQYRLEIEVDIETDLTLEEVQDRFDIWLLKYWVDEIPPEWEDQSISLEWYETIEFQEFKVYPICEECWEILYNDYSLNESFECVNILCKNCIT